MSCSTATNNNASGRTFGSAEHAMNRAWLRNTANGRIMDRDGEEMTMIRPVCGPFRAVMYAGDLLGRHNATCKGPDPLGKHAPQMSTRPPHHRRDCGMVRLGYTTDDVPIANCNTSKVWDASDYTQFKKLNIQRETYYETPSHLWKDSGIPVHRCWFRMR